MFSSIEYQENFLSTFNVANSDKIGLKSLQRRTDSKFITDNNLLSNILPLLKDHYSVLKAGNRYCATYKTQYFDTEKLSLFNDHKNGRRLRYKIRIREYFDRDLSFLEIKKRRSDIEQRKIRKPHNLNEFNLNDEDRFFIELNTNCYHKLIPTVLINCKRVNLINNSINERVTIDTAIEMASIDKKIYFNKLAIIEVKQWPYKRHSAIMEVLKNLNIPQKKVSKYCVAIALTNSNIRYNRLIPRVNILKGYIS